jgi:hypothetical protein
LSRVRQIDSGHIDRAMIDVDMFSKHLYSRYYPDFTRKISSTPSKISEAEPALRAV